jgi:hypothetical protein
MVKCTKYISNENVAANRFGNGGLGKENSDE